MEERIRVCHGCGSMVGWFALFCEHCGAKQAPHGDAAAGEAPPPPSGPSLEDETRVHLGAPAADAHAVARELFQTQLRLIHRHREAVEKLLEEAASLKRDLAAAGRARGRDETRAALDGLSHRMLEAEEHWGDLQVAYNKDSEMLEEESREHMEAADFDAYLSPDETSKVEGEFEVLKERFETVDSTLRDVGRAVALARQEGESRYLQGVGGRGRRPVVLVLVTAALVAWSLFSALFQYQEDPIRVAATVGPVLLALVIWVVRGLSQRG